MRRLACLTALATAATLFGVSDQAEACGGCFIGPSDNTVVTAHRMAMSISKEHTVLWDQIQYSGDSAEFSWVLPVKPGARIEVAADAWFDVLEASTGVTVGEPVVNCWSGDGWEGGGSSGSGSAFGCGSSDMASDMASGGPNEVAPPPPDVDVVHEGTVGPYETVTLSTDVPGALNEWMDEHGYAVPPDIQPVIDAYVADGFDLIALRLQPGNNVNQMKPVRVISPGSSLTLPLRMVAAGTGANTAVTLFLLGEGRYETTGYENVLVPQEETEWDFDTNSSNYSELRVKALEANNGHTWLTPYAKPSTLLSSEVDPLVPMGNLNVSYTVAGSAAETIAEAYVRQGVANGEGYGGSCENAFRMYANSDDLVVDTCDDEGNCEPTGAGEIQANEFACDELDDVAVALTGMHPRDVWITRLEADLPRSALETDLTLEASVQTRVENRFFAASHINHPCDAEAGAAAPLAFGGSGRTTPRIPGGPVSLTLAAAALMWFFRRRRVVAAASRA